MTPPAVTNSCQQTVIPWCSRPGWAHSPKTACCSGFERRYDTATAIQQANERQLTAPTSAPSVLLMLTSRQFIWRLTGIFWSQWETLISQSCVSGKSKALQQVYWHVFRSTKSLCCPRHDLYLCCLQPQSKILEWVRRLELVKILYSSERRSKRTDTIFKNPLHRPTCLLFIQKIKKRLFWKMVWFKYFLYFVFFSFKILSIFK